MERFIKEFIEAINTVGPDNVKIQGFNGPSRLEDVYFDKEGNVVSETERNERIASGTWESEEEV